MTRAWVSTFAAMTSKTCSPLATAVFIRSECGRWLQNGYAIIAASRHRRGCIHYRPALGVPRMVFQSGARLGNVVFEECVSA